MLPDDAPDPTLDPDQLDALDFNPMGPVLAGRLMKKARLALGISQNEVSRRTGINCAYINRMERGNRGTGRPSRAVLCRIAVALHLDPLDTDRLLYWCGVAPIVDWQAAYGRLLGELSKPLKARPRPRHLDDIVRDATV